jgi:hypothetical protein
MQLVTQKPKLENMHLQLAPGRLANVADTVDGVLDPARYLKQGRHGDWTPVSGIHQAPASYTMVRTLCVRELCAISILSHRHWTSTVPPGRCH